MSQRGPIAPPPCAHVERAINESNGASREFALKLKVVTPILGGSYHTRTLDHVDTIRVPSIRGQLRGWWRALYGHKYATSAELYDAESALWGGTANGPHDAHGPWRSSVSLRCAINTRGVEDTTDVRLFGGKDGPATDGAYALFVAKSQNRGADPPAPRRKPGTVFTLGVRVGARAPSDGVEQVRGALRAWILFGGVGGRTRRGLGALEPIDDATKGLAALDDVLALSKEAPCARDFASLRGARILVSPATDATAAWLKALGWLRDFRQGRGTDGNAAREYGEGNRAGRSRWPEADIVRRLDGDNFWHRANYKGPYAYPRAQFGLPIQAQWQTIARDKSTKEEPAKFELRLRDHERLASPLLVKPLWRGEKWYASAVWLSRGQPASPVAVFRSKREVSGSAVALDAWVENSLFAPLNEAKTTTEAFVRWLEQHHDARSL